MVMLVDDIGGMYVTDVQALCSARVGEGWFFIGATDHFLFWRGLPERPRFDALPTND